MNALYGDILPLSHASMQNTSVGKIRLYGLSPVALTLLIQIVTNLSGKSIVEYDCLLRLVESNPKWEHCLSDELVDVDARSCDS